MRHSAKRSFFLSTAAALALCPLSAQAQTAPEQDDEVVTTGTFISGARINEALPVTVFTQEDIQSIGTLDGQELIQSLPSQGATNFNGANNVTPNNARGDVASINLRSIGSSGTLVLLNGRRVVNHP